MKNGDDDDGSGGENGDDDSDMVADDYNGSEMIARGVLIMTDVTIWTTCHKSTIYLFILKLFICFWFWISNVLHSTN